MAAGRAALALSLALLAAAGAAAREPIIVGVNHTNLAWERPEDREAAIRGMAEAGIPAVRVAWVGTAEERAHILGLARTHGVGVLVHVNVDPDSLEDRTAMRPGRAEPFGPRPRLSRLDPARYAAQLRDAVAEAERAGVRVVGLQPGNELNWSAFNGDLPLGAPGGVWARIEDVPIEVRRPFVEGLRRYAAALRLYRAANPALAARTTLVSASIAYADDHWARRMEASAVAAPEMVRLLRETGALEVADALAIHVAGALDVRAEQLRARLAPCGAAEALGRPCWLTEFVIETDPRSCDLADTARLARLEATRQALRELPVRGAFLYAWAHDPPTALLRCGRPSALAERLGAWGREEGRREEGGRAEGRRAEGGGAEGGGEKVGREEVGR